MPSASHADAAPVRAAKITPVTTCLDDGGAGTLRTIVGNAVSGDTIDLGLLECSTMVLQSGEIEVAVDDLVIAGPGRDALTIDGADTSRIFLHTGAGTLELHDVSLTRGRVVDGNGGCVSSSNGNITLVDAAVAGCTAHDASGQSDYAGGGGLSAAGDIALLRSTVSDNTASADAARTLGGGGLLSLDREDDAGNISIADSIVSGNRVLSTSTGSDVDVYGGGLDSRGTMTIVRSVVSGNSVSSDSVDDEEESITEGGGVYTVDLYALDSTFSGNSVTNSGGAIDVAGGAIASHGATVISGSTLEGNHAGMLAGGVLQTGGVPGVSRLEIVNSTVSHNTAGFYGAGVAALTNLVLRNSTVAFNEVDDASPFGIGGVLIGSNDTTNAYRIESSIISNNLANSKSPWGADLAVLFADSIFTIAGGNNLVGENSGLNLPADTLSGDPMLLPLADNGGLTRTHALAEGSPAIDAGSNVADLDFDQRGGYYVRAFGVGVDIGAFEGQPTPDVIFRNGFDFRE